MSEIIEPDPHWINRWVNQEPFVVTSEHLALKWGGGRGLDNFVCGFCFHPFEEGETARWIYVPDANNTFVCTEHDGPDVVERFQERWRTVISPILKRWGA